MLEKSILVAPGAPGGPGSQDAPVATWPLGKPYARPRITRLGNMVDVTLKSGPATDNAAPHDGKKF